MRCVSYIKAQTSVRVPWGTNEVKTKYNILGKLPVSQTYTVLFFNVII